MDAETSYCPSLADFQSSEFIASVCPRPIPEVRRMPELRMASAK